MFRARRQRAGPRVRMRLLVLGLTGAEPAFRAWTAWLRDAGVPFDAVALKDSHRLLRFSGPHGMALYHGLILSQAGLTELALEPHERATLERQERELGIRRLIAYGFPGPEHGLTEPHRSGELEGIEASLTAAGREVFPYLRGRLPIDPGSWAHLAAPESAQSFETLVAGPDETALVGIHRRPDGREEMVQTFDANGSQAQGQLLRRGQVAWLCRGVYIGHARHYLSVQIDDVLLGNHSWSVDAHRSDRASKVRMTADDAARAAAWTRSRGLRLDLACNGAGVSVRSRRDPLLAALLAERDAFGWINHTYQHADLDDLGQAEIEAEIGRNVSWAAGVGIELEPAAVVTGAHTGLADLTADPPRAHNPYLPAALTGQRISWVACDASRPYPGRPGSGPLAPGTPFAVGDALAVPRHPTVLPHDAATPSQVLDQLRSAGRDDGGPAAPITSFGQVIAAEARRVLNAAIGNDPRPHYFHQSNLIGVDDASPGIVYALLDAVLARYHAHLTDDAPLLQPTLGEIGRMLRRRQAWRTAADAVTAYRENGRVVVVNPMPAAVRMPLAGTAAGEVYGGERSGWIQVDPGRTVLTAS